MYVRAYMHLWMYVCRPLWPCHCSLFRSTSEYVSTSQIPRKHRLQHPTCEWTHSYPDWPTRRPLITLAESQRWICLLKLFSVSCRSVQLLHPQSSILAGRWSGERKWRSRWCERRPAAAAPQEGWRNTIFSFYIRLNSNLSRMDFAAVIEMTSRLVE